MGAALLLYWLSVHAEHQGAAEAHWRGDPKLSVPVLGACGCPIATPGFVHSAGCVLARGADSEIMSSGGTL